MEDVQLSLLARLELAETEEEIVALKKELAMAFTMGNFSVGCGQRLQDKLLDKVDQGQFTEERKTTLKAEIYDEVGIE